MKNGPAVNDGRAASEQSYRPSNLSILVQTSFKICYRYHARRPCGDMQGEHPAWGLTVFRCLDGGCAP